MKPNITRIVLLATFALLLFVSFRTPSTSFDKITVREFELIDQNNKVRVSIKVEPEGEVVLRLKDKNETIRVKLGANEEGSGLVLLDHTTSPGIHALSKEGGKLTLRNKEGEERKFE